MKTSRLTPTPIVDKNGKQTTVHKKTAPALDARKALPGPAINPRETLEYETAVALCANDPTPESKASDTSSQHYVSCRKVLSGYSTATLQRVRGIAETARGYDLLEMISFDGIPEDTANDYCMLSPVLEAEKMYRNEGFRHLNALPHYKHLDLIVAGDYPDKRLAKATAIIRVTKHLEMMGVDVLTENPYDEDESWIKYIPDEKLRDLLTTSDNPERTADIIIERNIFDEGEINAVLATMDETPDALQNGVL
jgi:hypothetical protein